MTSSTQPSWHEGDLPGLRFAPHLVETFQRYLLEEADADTDLEYGVPCQLTRAAKRVLGADGAGLCVQTTPEMRLPLGASDAVAATAERLQFTVGEGPCFEALAGRRPIAITEASMLQRWPVLAVLHQQQTPFRSGLAIPLRAGQLCFGALDVYLVQSQPLQGHDVIAGQVIAQCIADILLETLEPATSGDTTREAVQQVWDGPSVRARREVWVAAGMANLILGLRQDDALATLRAQALLGDQSLDDLAHDIVTGHFDLAELNL